MPTILLTGGAGYIGSHTAVELMAAGFDVLIYDNFCRSSAKSVDRVARIAGKAPKVVEGDVRDSALLAKTLREHDCSAVLHFAGLKAVGESTEKPLDYFDTNFFGTLRLLQAMQTTAVRTIVFSSSATVYGEPVRLPYTEDHPLFPTNPYGRSKLMAEDALRDLFRAEPDWRIGILRYFNPGGAHPSALIGEDPVGIPNNLMPFVAQVAAGTRPVLNIWGQDYPTADGTGERDYIHVVDLALGHVKALMRLDSPQCSTVNLGTGKAHSVLEVVRGFEAACGHAIPYVIKERRPGDLPSYYADPASAKKWLGWEATRDLQTMCADHWRWQSQNPKGYA